MSSFLKSKAPRRPPVVKMPDSAFFEDKRDRAVGQTSRWRPLWIVSAALLVLVVSAYFAYSNLWLLAVGGVPDAALAAAREANTTIPDPETTMAYRTPSGYRVLFLGSSVIGGWRPSVTHS